MPKISESNRAKRRTAHGRRGANGAGSADVGERVATMAAATVEERVQDGVLASEFGPDTPAGLQGRIERIGKTGIAGWVWNPRAPGERIRLELVEGETCLKSALAADERPDLVQLGCGDGRHGFTIGLEEGALSEGRHTLILRCADTGEEVPGSPVALRCGRATAEQAQETQDSLRYNIDKVSDNGILGWIMMPEQPSNRSVVALKHDGYAVAKTIASRFRADLLAAGVGDGCYGFELPLPHPVVDGRIHTLEIVEQATGTSLTSGPVPWSSDVSIDTRALPFARSNGGYDLPQTERVDWATNRSLLDSAYASHGVERRFTSDVGTRILFDISDLVYYIGHHPNLTGIQRVQSSIVLSIFDGNILPPASVRFLSFDAGANRWITIPTGFLVSFLRDLLLPASERLITFDEMSARRGVLPGAQPFEGIGWLEDGNPSVLCLLGAAWVQQDYVHRVLALKRRFGMRFVMMVNDLISYICKGDLRPRHGEGL